MLIKVYETDQFETPKNYNERVVVFQSVNPGEENAFELFTKNCMMKEILIDSFYTLNLITNRREIAKSVNRDYMDEIEEVEFDILYEVWDMLNTVLIHKEIKTPDNIKKAYRIYDHDWTYFFYAVESDEGFYAYNWSSPQ